MPDTEDAPGAQPSAEPTAEDARLIRSVRWRLVAFSGGSTLVVLLALGLALYLSVATSLQAASQALLDDRARDIAAQVNNLGPGPAPDQQPSTDFIFGGGGTFAVVTAPDGTTISPTFVRIRAGLPDVEADSAAAAAGDHRDVRLRTVTFGGFGAADVAVPVRQLTVAARCPAQSRITMCSASPGATYYVQVIQDRTTEARTLQSLLVVLVIGGLVVVLVGVGFGAVYARRALVPIRDSLAGQRAALRRQREFAADASHELRTPLTVIRASVEHLRRHADEPVQAVGDALGDIDAEVGHLTAMVEDLLLLARSDSGAVSLDEQPVELDDVASEAASALRGPAEERGVRLVLDPEPAPVIGDPTRLRQLVTLLVDNAIRHSPAGGEVRIEVRRDGDVVRLAVSDQGPGIRAEDLPRVFDRFWRASDAPSGGTGLGLAIAKWIAERHGGGITATNRTEGGARFEVELPGRPAATSTLEPSAPLP
jgi:signal transduction histidine kinase